MPPAIRDLVTVAEVATVVRLDDASGLYDELVITGDVAVALEAVLGAGDGGAGAGFFVVGPFGSGKSHFLSSIGELLGDEPEARRTPHLGPSLAALARSARRSLAVGVPLVEHRAAAALEDVVAARLWRQLDGAEPTAAQNDRVDRWDEALAAAQAGGYDGLVLLVDELSEFLRAKSGPALTEDLRFLQFLGEWSGDRPVLVVAALQESIDEVANVSERELSRIRDRYRPSLTLSMRHVEDLVRGRLVKLAPEAEEWVAKAHAEVTRSFPAVPMDAERFRRAYPIHPDTLGLLDGLKFLLSQQRGVVDFVCRQVRADLDRPYTDLVTPERVFDHFRDRLHERRQTAQLADAVVPYYERAVLEMFDDPVDRELALRCVKLLSLLSISPVERPRTAPEIAGMLLAKVSTVDPQANTAYLEKVILGPLVGRGAYVVATHSVPPVYGIAIEADAAVVLRARVAQSRAEIHESDRRILTTLRRLGSTANLPFELLVEVGYARRNLMWQNTQRSLLLGVARILDVTPTEVERLWEGAHKAGADGVLLAGEIELSDPFGALAAAKALTAGAEHVVVWLPDRLSPEERASLLDIHARAVTLAAFATEGREDLARVLSKSSEADGSAAREMMRRAYFSGVLVVRGEEVTGGDLPSLAGLSFERLLPALADPLLRSRYPDHHVVAPRAELVGDRIVRELLTDFVAHGRVGAGPLDRGRLRQLIEGYLAPLGVARARRDGALIAPDVRTPAVAEVVKLVGDDKPVPMLGVAQSLASGRLGLTEPECLLLLNACVAGGLVEGWRGRSRLELPFMAVTEADRLGPGELAAPAVRETAASLSPFVTGPGPFEPWTSAVQRSTWEYVRAWLEALRENVAQARSGLDMLAELPGLSSVHTAELQDDLAYAETILQAVDPKSGPVAGLRALAEAIPLDRAEGTIECGRRLTAVARLFRDELRRVASLASYIHHPDLELPERDEQLGRLYGTVASLLPEVIDMAARSELEQLLSAGREFRTAYVASYRDAHDAFYAAVSPSKVQELRSAPAYRALAALSGIGRIAVPDDLVKVDRMMAAATPVPCRRPVESELAFKPKCSCGYSLSQVPPELDSATVLAVAATGVAEHIQELASPAVIDRLRQGADDLVTLGRDETAIQLRTLSELVTAGTSGEPIDWSAVSSLLTAELQGVVRDVVGQGKLIATRDLASLRENIIGRQYPRRRLLELFTQWIDGGDDIPPNGFIEVVDSTETPGGFAGQAAGAPSHGARAGAGASAAVGGRLFAIDSGSAVSRLLASRFPRLYDALPRSQAPEAFWLACWWAGRKGAPAWVEQLPLDPTDLARAAEVALAEADTRADLADLDQKTTAGTVMGDQIAEALQLSSASFEAVATCLASEQLLRLPARLAADQLVRRLAGAWYLADTLPAREVLLAPGHALLTGEERAAGQHLVAAASHLAEVERRLAGASAVDLASDLYPSHACFVPELVSRARLSTAGRSLVEPEAAELFAAAADRLLGQLQAAWEGTAEAGFPGCLTMADVGREVVSPLLARSGRVAVLIVDAMRADVFWHVAEEIGRVLPARSRELSWAVVPNPTRTMESLAALELGRAVGEGSVPNREFAPFAHLGYEVDVLPGADRDHKSADLRALWECRSPITVAVASSLDERLHRTSAELATLIDDAVRAVSTRALASLSAVPPDVPVVVMADHGFRENPWWGRGPEGRYRHGGTSLEECVIPVLAMHAEVRA